MQYVILSEAIKLLLDEQLVVIPTETVYGLAGLAISQIAVDRIFEYKKRPSDNPLICHFCDKNHILEYIETIPKPLEILIDRFCPGPLSLILTPNDNRLSPSMRGQQTVACRIPNNLETLELIRQIRIPLAAPSANPSGMPSSTTDDMAFEYFRDFPGGILKSQQSDIGIESTIVEFKDNAVYILREGAIGLVEIRQALPDIQVLVNQNPQHVVPGSKYRHYAPNTPIIPITDLSQIDYNIQFVLISTRQDLSHSPIDTTVVYISDTHNTADISHNLYKTLIDVDTLHCARAYWYIPDRENQSSLGQALENRLQKVFETKTMSNL